MADTVSEAAVAAVVAATPTVTKVAVTPASAKAKQYQLALTGIKLQQAISSGQPIKVVEVY
jgi:hypothetical protein